MCNSCAGARLARGRGRTIRGAPIHSSTASMTGYSSEQAPQSRAVRWWLLSVAALIVIMVLVGGATRLTESGLSIVEWKPVTGAMPPLGEAQWRGLRGLQDHPAISRTQCRHVARRVQDHLLVGMEPPAARARDRRGLSVAVSLVPVARRAQRGTEAAVVADLRARRAAGRGRLVDGGVRPDAAAEVSQYRLATHLVLALVIFAAIVWTLRRLADRPRPASPRGCGSPVWRCWC